MQIYVAENLVNHKRYIGRTKGKLSRRIVEHISAAMTEKENVYFHNAIKKYTASQFVWSSLCHCSSIEELNEKEKYYIALYRTNDSQYGYNLTNGGEGCEGYKHTQETRKIMSEKKSGAFDGRNNPMFGKHHSATTRKVLSESKSGDRHPFYGKPRPIETRRKISESNKGKTPSAETRKKISESLIGRFAGAKNPNFGKASFIGRKHSDETKERMRVAALSRLRDDSGMFISNTPQISRRPYVE